MKGDFIIIFISLTLFDSKLIVNSTSQIRIMKSSIRTVHSGMVEYSGSIQERLTSSIIECARTCSENVPSKSSNCLSHVAWHNHWIVLNLGSTDSSWNGAFVIFFREGPSIWSRLSILYGVIQFCERTWRWKVEDNAPWHQNFTRMSNLARNKCHAFADQS